jgi:DegV family protein with EDD domain
MTKIALITDSSNDLPPSILASHHIDVVPLMIHFGDEEFHDVYENRESFWKRLDQGELPRSAAPSVGAFYDAFAAALHDADEVIAITITSKHSSTYGSALLAAAEFEDKVHVFDSWAISLGVGLLVLRAARLIEQGAETSDILADLEAARSRLRITLYLDSLDAIQRGGRIALAMEAIKRMSSMFSIKIILSMTEGELGFAGAVRSAKKGMRHIVESIAEHQAEAVAVAHTRTPERAGRLADLAAATLDFPRGEILVAEAGPILGVHGGAGAFGVTFFERASQNEPTI